MPKTPNAPTILCMNCRYYEARGFAMDDRCLHPESFNQISVVRGGETRDYSVSMRLGGKCGIEAKFFEPAKVDAKA